jgi:cardiolipin synthase A/B
MVPEHLMWTEIDLFYPLIITLASFGVAVFASAHVVLYKRDVRAAIGWVGIIWLTPFVGSLLYLGLGINRVSRRAQKRHPHDLIAPPLPKAMLATVNDVAEWFGSENAHLRSLVHYGDNITGHPLVRGNAVKPFYTGDDAYSAMLEAIRTAKKSVSLATYIFDNDAAGRMFVDALKDAHDRGVEVRVLIDDVGVRYTFPSIRRPLRKAGIPHATFFPTLIPWKLHYSNLRTHRKLLVVDGKTGFTGGMNIRQGHLSEAKDHPIRDMHFRLEGPVVRHLQETFVVDWDFVTGEVLRGDLWFPEPEMAGDCLARGIEAGPETHGDRIRLTLMGALACARKSVFIVTPYFLPDAGLIHAMNTADLRGVNVQILLPAKNNLALVQWASTAMLWQVLERGVQVWLSPPPFDHTKLMIVDGYWTLLGSSNWDPRSLRLNFEFNVECYDETLADELSDWVEQRILQSRAVTLRDVDSRPLVVRLRDGVARLLSPYL